MKGVNTCRGLSTVPGTERPLCKRLAALSTSPGSQACRQAAVVGAEADWHPHAAPPAAVGVTPPPVEGA